MRTCERIVRPIIHYMKLYASVSTYLPFEIPSCKMLEDDATHWMYFKKAVRYADSSNLAICSSNFPLAI